MADDVITSDVITASRQNTASFHTIIHSQLINILQQECYSVARKLKCHNACSKYLPLVWSRMHHCLMTESRLSVTVALSLISGELNNNKRICIAQVCRMTSEALIYLVYGREVVYSLKFQRTHTCIGLPPHLCTSRYSE